MSVKKVHTQKNTRKLLSRSQAFATFFFHAPCTFPPFGGDQTDTDTDAASDQMMMIIHGINRNSIQNIRFEEKQNDEINNFSICSQRKK